MRDLSDPHRRFGHPRLHILLRREGFGANHKKTHRIYVEEGLQVRKRKKRRRSAITRRPLVFPSRPGERWSMDFMSDQLSCGRRIRLFNVIDDFTRQCHTILADQFTSYVITALNLCLWPCSIGRNAKVWICNSSNRANLLRMDCVKLSMDGYAMSA